MSTTAEQSSAAERPRRADALRNRSRVLEAAHAAFAEHGLEAQMEDVARRAGVGVGTVYRHFPTKEALLDALVVARFAEINERAQAALARTDADPMEELAGVLRHAKDLQSTDRGFADIVASTLGASAACRAQLEELHVTTGGLLDRARAAGSLREDFTFEDIGAIMCGLAAVQRHKPHLADRYLALVLDGMRAVAR